MKKKLKTIVDDLLEYWYSTESSQMPQEMALKPCTLKDYEGCRNYQGEKKIPYCPNCPYRGNMGGER